MEDIGQYSTFFACTLYQVYHHTCICTCPRKLSTSCVCLLLPVAAALSSLYEKEVRFSQLEYFRLCRLFLGPARLTVRSRRPPPVSPRLPPAAQQASVLSSFIVTSLEDPGRSLRRRRGLVRCAAVSGDDLSALEASLVSRLYCRSRQLAGLESQLLEGLVSTLRLFDDFRRANFR